MRSPLRYPGGKSRLVRSLLEVLREEIKGTISHVYSPFLGGGSFELALLDEYPSALHYWADRDWGLMNFWWHLVYKTENLHAEVTDMFNRKQEAPRGFYEEIKDFDDDGDACHLAAAFFALNRMSFSGLGKAGGYSESAATKRFTESSIQRMYTTGRDLRNKTRTLNLSLGDFKLNLQLVKARDSFVFLDPPYISSEKSRLYGKAGENHVRFEHETLAGIIKSASWPFMMTIDDCEKTRELYPEELFRLTSLQVQYGMSSFTGKHISKKQELVITRRS